MREWKRHNGMSISPVVAGLLLRAGVNHLHEPASRRFADIVRILLEAGADATPNNKAEVRSQRPVIVCLLNLP